MTVAGVATAAGVLWWVERQRPRTSPLDRVFFARAAEASQAALAMSRLVPTRADAGEVRRLASMMLHDHTRASNDLRQLALEQGLDFPLGPSALLADMAQLSGPEFERRFIETVIRDHLEAVALFRAELERGVEAELVAIARKYLPRWQEHLALARSISAHAAYRLRP